MITELQVLVAVLLDTVLGEPKRFHPSVGFMRLALRVESSLFGREQLNDAQLKFRGMLAWCFVILPFVIFIFWVTQQFVWLAIVVEAVLLYFAIGSQSLAQHAIAVSNALIQSDLPLARQQVQMMVSCDTENMQDEDISRATIESVLDNGNDAIFAAIFWFLVLGGPGVILYRLSNTLDVMWGCRHERYNAFGWFAAHVDDALNWLPARLAALTYALMGQTRNALYCWKTQAKSWKDINSGVVMASGAGAMGLTLGGSAQYHGQQVARPLLGQGSKPNALNIKASVQLVQRSLWLWLGVIFFEGLFVIILIH